MTEVVSIKFKNRGKSYYFAPKDLRINNGMGLIVETANGAEFAHCVYGNHYVADEKVTQPLRPVLRIASAQDLEKVEQNLKKEKEARKVCRELIVRHGLEMKLVDVECNFEGTKTLFFFTADGRVDFRELVKDLAAIFRNRIELRQIGVRDEAKMLGGIGVCGRAYCCNQFFEEFYPVSTKMAKVQSMSLNPSKISGSCGRLMCCLRYEEPAYEELNKLVPKSGSFVETPDGYGIAIQVSLLRQNVKVRLDGEGNDNDQIRLYHADDIIAIPGGRPKPGEPYPRLLKDKPRKERDTGTVFPKELLGYLPNSIMPNTGTSEMGSSFGFDTVSPDVPTPPTVDTEQTQQVRNTRGRARGNTPKEPRNSQAQDSSDANVHGRSPAKKRPAPKGRQNNQNTKSNQSTKPGQQNTQGAKPGQQNTQGAKPGQQNTQGAKPNQQNTHAPGAKNGGEPKAKPNKPRRPRNFKPRNDPPERSD